MAYQQPPPGEHEPTAEVHVDQSHVHLRPPPLPNRYDNWPTPRFQIPRWLVNALIVPIFLIVGVLLGMVLAPRDQPDETRVVALADTDDETGLPSSSVDQDSSSTTPARGAGAAPEGLSSTTLPTTESTSTTAESSTTASTATTAAPATAAPTTTLSPTTSTEAPGSDCHPAYTPCLPNLPGDALNCGDLSGAQKPVTVHDVNVDPYGLDGNDRDGLGCES